MNLDDDLRKLLADHEWDQVGAAFASIAGVLGQYFRALLVEGFEREEALTLAVQLAEMFWRRTILREREGE